MIVLDTHALIWLDCDDPALGAQSRTLIESSWRKGCVAVSAISWWECAMLAQRGRIQLPVPIERWRSDWLEAGVVEVPVDGRVALASAGLEGLHRDPADRFIVATAKARDATLVTADERLLGWQGAVARHDARH